MLPDEAVWALSAAPLRPPGDATAEGGGEGARVVAEDPTLTGLLGQLGGRDERKRRLGLVGGLRRGEPAGARPRRVSINTLYKYTYKI